MWLDYLHNDDPPVSQKESRSRAKAVAGFARLQQDVIRGARKRGESDAQIVQLIELTILEALLDEKRMQ